MHICLLPRQNLQPLCQYDSNAYIIIPLIYMSQIIQRRIASFLFILFENLIDFVRAITLDFDLRLILVKPSPHSLIFGNASLLSSDWDLL